jgi:hypothetical protein
MVGFAVEVVGGIVNVSADTSDLFMMQEALTKHTRL